MLWIKRLRLRIWQCLPVVGPLPENISMWPPTLARDQAAALPATTGTPASQWSATICPVWAGAVEESGGEGRRAKRGEGSARMVGKW